jgi:hypothetical protein
MLGHLGPGGEHAHLEVLPFLGHAFEIAEAEELADSIKARAAAESVPPLSLGPKV